MSQLSIPTQPKFQSHTAARPMLARDADSMYWMSRYVERAEHVARLLLVNSNLLVDVGDLANSNLSSPHPRPVHRAANERLDRVARDRQV